MAYTHNDLFPNVYDFENLFNAYLKARKNKRYNEDVLKFSANLEENLIQLQNELIYKTYEPGIYREFYVYDPKTRLVMAAPFRDRVLHHALCNVIEPIFDRTFYYHSYACRTNKGTHSGVACTVKYLRKITKKHEHPYCFKADISKYFQSINHRILMDIICQKIICKDTIWLIQKIVDSTANPTDINPVGLPVGNLTSQLCANIYLNELDKHIKHDLKCGYYIRYMDDFLILHPDKRYLNSLWAEVKEYLNNRLALKMNQKTAIFPIDQGVDFLGYRIWPNRIIIRKGSVKRIKRIVKKFNKRRISGNISDDKIRSVLASWLGHSKRADVPKLRKIVLDAAKDMFGIEGLS